MQVLLSPVVLFTATQWSGPAPCYEPCLLSKNVAGALSGWALESQRSMLRLQTHRQREWQREIDGETDREEAEVCLHLCDNVWPSRPVSSLSGWPRRTAMREDRRGSASLPIYHWPWPGRLWNFRDSFNGLVVWEKRGEWRWLNHSPVLRPYTGL